MQWCCYFEYYSFFNELLNIIVVVYLFWYYYYVKSGPSFLKFIYIDGIPPNFSIMFGLWMEGMREEKRESDGRGLNKSYLDFLLKSEREGFFFFFGEREGRIWDG